VLSLVGVGLVALAMPALRDYDARRSAAGALPRRRAARDGIGPGVAP
jgi:hypothetical protein